MAYTKKTNVEAEVKEEKVDKETHNTPRKFEPEDIIPCRSLVSGGLYIEGNRSKLLYSWADYGDVVDVEYRDLIYMVRTHGDSSIYEPRIIIEDDDFVSQNKALADFYETLYADMDLHSIINMPTSQMKKAIEQLPNGAKNAIKGIVSTMIDDHKLDSVSKIKALDELFGTNMLLTLVEN